MSIPINSDRIHKNLLLGDQFVNLSAKSKKTILKQLSSSERKVVLKIIKKNGDVTLSQKKWDKLDDRLKKVSQLPTKLTRKEKNLSGMSKLKSSLGRFADNVAYFFNFLTADKANSLINKAIIKKDRSAHINPLPCISKVKLKQLIKDARKNENQQAPIDLAKLLEGGGFSTELKGCDFGAVSFKDVRFEGITFVDCKFNWTKFGDTSLIDVTFKHCDIFNLSVMGGSTLSGCQFERCEIRETMFIGSNMENVIFKNCDIISSSFEDSKLESCLFQNSVLAGTHFFDSSIHDCTISNSNLKNTVFFDTFSKFTMDDGSLQTALIDRPTTALLVDPESVGITVPKAFLKLDKSSNVLPLRITMKPQKTTQATVNNEVEAALRSVGPYDPEQPPIPQRLLHELANNPGSEAFAILKKAEKLALHVNSIFLPGGEDVPPALYGQDVEDKTAWGGDYRRSILELGLVHQSFNKGVPLMALCRGFQVANIYFGAQLIQDVEGHKGVQKFKLNNPENIGLYAEVLKENIIGACFHHQGVPITSGPTEHLETSVLYENLIKASELKESGSVPMILLQFHPELYRAKTARTMQRQIIDRGLDVQMSEKNEMFWDIFYDSAKTQQNKIELMAQVREGSPRNTEAVKDAITELEDKLDESLQDVKQEHHKWETELFNDITEYPEYFLPIYLSLPDQHGNDPYLDEREAIEKALRYDDTFLKLIMGVNKDRVINIIQESRQDLYDELSESSLKPYIL